MYIVLMESCMCCYGLQVSGQIQIWPNTCQTREKKIIISSAERTTLLLPSDPQNVHVQRSKQCVVLHARHHRVLPAERKVGKKNIQRWSKNFSDSEFEQVGIAKQESKKQWIMRGRQTAWLSIFIVICVRTYGQTVLFVFITLIRGVHVHVAREANCLPPFPNLHFTQRHFIFLRANEDC